jgi:hypothetical protein
MGCVQFCVDLPLQVYDRFTRQLDERSRYYAKLEDQRMGYDALCVAPPLLVCDRFTHQYDEHSHYYVLEDQRKGHDALYVVPPLQVCDHLDHLTRELARDILVLLYSPFNF